MCQTPAAKKSSSAVRQFTWAEIDESRPKEFNVKGASTKGPVYIVIDGKVYDVGGDFVRWHPGGAVIISQMGKDASSAFEVFHPESAYETLANFYVGDLKDGEPSKQNDFAHEIKQLRAKFEKAGYFKSSKLFYAYKILSNLALLSASLGTLAYLGNNLVGIVFAAVCMGLFLQQCGWLAHDFLHHQVFENRAINNAFGYVIGNVAQGFSVAWWKNKHCTHHSAPNIHQQDPDIDTMPYLAWSEHALELFSDFKDDTVARFLVSRQSILYFPILSLARIPWALHSILFVLPGHSECVVSDPTMLLIERSTLAIHWVWYLGTAFYFLSPLHALLYILLSQTVGGLFLASVFSLNHNGMSIYDDVTGKDIEFYQLQVDTGRNVTPTHFNNWFTGGLNFQIEHHLFPTIPRHHIGKTAPDVMAVCKKYGIPYHSTSFSGGIQEVVSRLGVIGKMSVKIAQMKQ
ncbi:fatty acid desaturase-domain-containing protein [Polychytrium aggregatum]|uniref:fatty acid desaturase-domain-containing protein n=1 Tax=Polychytrium aggregatum TaxID=110093 RepID=UPI0022FE4C9F|nr:fatty acid desaturase-domain-containing protein [Polychytrium aggregatum]KAI9203735.1 fatty acid desaturase-domain-containing protein [Polychytrium aggregatum]